MEWPFQLLVSEAGGTIKASQENSRAEDALEATRNDAVELGLETHGLSIADADGDAGKLSMPDSQLSRSDQD